MPRAYHATGPLVVVCSLDGALSPIEEYVGAALGTLGALVATESVETHDEWAVAERRYLGEESMANIGQPVTTVEEAPLGITA